LVIADQNISRAKKLAKKHNIPQATDNTTSVVASPELDLIIILTPPNQHYPLAKKAIQLGKNVLVEKPIAFNQKQAQELLVLANEKKVRIASNFVLRYHPFHRQIRQFVKKNTYGKLTSIFTTALLAKYPAEHWYWNKNISGGFFLNTYCHFLDLQDYIIGKPASNSGYMGRLSTGQLIVQEYPHTLASLAVNLLVNNEQEKVETTYVFQHCLIKTTDWLPARMELIPDQGKPAVLFAPPKDELYRSILAEILREMVADIGTKDAVKRTRNLDCYNGFSSAIKAQTNKISLK